MSASAAISSLPSASNISHHSANSLNFFNSSQLTLTELNSNHIRSKPSDIKVYCRFVNCTNRLVAPIWIDFIGRRVRYPCLKPGGCLNVETYEKHPWCFLDAQDLTIVLTSNQGQIFWPRHNIPASSLPLCIVKITLPQFTLLELSLQTITKFSIPTYSLPESLQDLIKERQKYTNQISFVIHPEGSS